MSFAEEPVKHGVRRLAKYCFAGSYPGRLPTVGILNERQAIPHELTG